MTLTALFVVPEYSGELWEALPNLGCGAGELARLLEDHDVQVLSTTFGSVDEVTQALADTVKAGTEPLLVYVGGHGIVDRRRHYTALDTTPARSPSQRDALWSASVAELLAGRGRDVLVVLDSCFSGEGALDGSTEALRALADVPNGGRSVSWRAAGRIRALTTGGSLRGFSAFCATGRAEMSTRGVLATRR